MAENKSIDVRGYYQSLSKKEKGQFLRYLTMNYGYSVHTLSAKLRENTNLKLRKNEELDIMETVSRGLWRQ
jgi:hypothetical protein